LGSSNSHKGYKCLDASGRIFISKDVVFNEVKFPYLDLFPSQKVCPVLPDGPTLSTFLPTPVSTTFTVNSPTPQNSHSESVPTIPISNTPQTPSISSHHSESSHRNNVVLNPTHITFYLPLHLKIPDLCHLLVLLALSLQILSLLLLFLTEFILKTVTQ